MRTVVRLVNGEPEGVSSYQDLRLRRTKAGHPIADGFCEVDVTETKRSPTDRIRELEGQIERMTVAMRESGDTKLEEIAEATKGTREDVRAGIRPN